MEIALKAYDGEHEEIILRYIASFFHTHHSKIDDAQARGTLANWTDEDHEFFYIIGDGRPVGFLHLHMRGPVVCWIEDIFVDENLRKQGIASKAIGLVEEIMKKRNIEGICMDVVPDNIPALRLYHRLGYDRLSIVTVRKDFQPFETERTEQINGLEFRVKKFED